MRNLLIVSLLLVMLYSCKKDEIQEDQNQHEPSKTYLPLESGNYWIYQSVTIDSLGNEVPKEMYDSIVVTGVENIRGNQYYEVEQHLNYAGTLKDLVDVGRPFLFGKYLRDSLGYIINKSGTISLSSSNFTDTLKQGYQTANNDTVCYITYKMEHVNQPVTVPAGDFEVIRFRGTVQIDKDWIFHEEVVYSNTYYAEDVGVVKETAPYLSGKGGVGRNLVRFHVK